MVVFREVTVVLLFLPAGVFGVRELQRKREVGWDCQPLGLLVAIGIHESLVVYVQTMKRRATE